MLSVARAKAGASTVVDGDVAALCPPCATPVTAVLESIELKPRGLSDGGLGTSTARGRPSRPVPLPAAGATGTLADLPCAGRGAALATPPSTGEDDSVVVDCCDCSDAAGGEGAATRSGTAPALPDSFSPNCLLTFLCYHYWRARAGACP